MKSSLCAKMSKSSLVPNPTFVGAGPRCQIKKPMHVILFILIGFSGGSLEKLVPYPPPRPHITLPKTICDLAYPVYLKYYRAMSASRSVSLSRHTLRQLKFVIPGGAITYYLGTHEVFWKMVNDMSWEGWGRCVKIFLPLPSLTDLRGNRFDLLQR